MLIINHGVVEEAPTPVTPTPRVVIYDPSNAQASDGNHYPTLPVYVKARPSEGDVFTWTDGKGKFAAAGEGGLLGADDNGDLMPAAT